MGSGSFRRASPPRVGEVCVDRFLLSIIAYSGPKSGSRDLSGLVGTARVFVQLGTAVLLESCRFAFGIGAEEDHVPIFG
jgi:hypothetical protein